MRFALAGAFVATFAAAAAIIYFAVGSRHSLTAQPLTSSMATAAGPAAAADSSVKSDAGAKSMETEVAALEARLARDGGTSDDWTLLAKAYEFLGRPDDAARARAHIAKPAAGATVSQMSAGALVAAATATETRGPAAGGAASMPAAATPEPTLSPAPAPSPAELEKRVKQNPRDVESWLALAELHRVQHDDRDARDALAKVIALHGMTAQSWAHPLPAAPLPAMQVAPSTARSPSIRRISRRCGSKRVRRTSSATSPKHSPGGGSCAPRCPPTRPMPASSTPISSRTLSSRAFRSPSAQRLRERPRRQTLRVLQARQAQRKYRARSRSTVVLPAACSATRPSLYMPRRRTRPARRSRCCAPRRAHGLSVFTWMTPWP